MNFIKRRKETTLMEHNKMNNNTANSVFFSILETLWAIGTSITASAVLITFNISIT